jgi:hypothetical protein
MKNYNGFKVMLMGLFIMIPFAISTHASDVTQPDQTDFSGTWKLDENKSDFGEGRHFAAHQLVVTQQDNSLKVERSSTGRDGREFKFTSDYTLDGQQHDLDMGNRTAKVKADWQNDGKNVQIDTNMKFERNGETNEFHTLENWTLSGDGKTLTIDLKTNSRRGESHQKLIYTK